MEVNYAYKGSTAVIDRADRTQMSFSPDTKREPTFFMGELRQNIEFRAAISALHDVVVSDQRFKPKDKTAYKEWAAKQLQIDWQLVAVQKEEVAKRMKVLQNELKELNNNSYQRLKPYYDARNNFYQYAWQKQLDILFLFDPVITVHPDEIFFECFSVDESSYGVSVRVTKSSKISTNSLAVQLISTTPTTCITNFRKSAITRLPD